MQSGKILWGLILLLAGVLLLLDNLGVVAFSWYDIVIWWPLLLIYWGISAFTHTPGARVVGFLIFLLVAAGLITASVRYGWMQTVDTVGQTQELREVWQPVTTAATFTLQSGAGEFIVDGSATDSLVSANTITPFGQYDLSTTYTGTEASSVLSLSQSRPWQGMMMTRVQHRVLAHLNPNPIWTIVVESGAASINLDLTKLKVKDVTVKSGASSVEAALSDMVDHAIVTVKTGASSVDLTVPTTVGCKITTESGLSSLEFPGFVKQADGTYQTADYATAKKTIDISLAAGVSSLSVTQQ